MLHFGLEAVTSLKLNPGAPNAMCIHSVSRYSEHCFQLINILLVATAGAQSNANFIEVRLSAATRLTGRSDYTKDL